MERIAMTQEERDWLEWLKRARDGVITQRKAAEKMGVTDRWVRVMLGRMAEVGDAVVVHGLRGRPSNRRIDTTVKDKAMKILRDPDWHDFGPTFASEQLAKRHGIQVSKETLRNWMISDGQWKTHSSKAKEVHVWRERRHGYGELVQWDTSTHDWLEGRGEPVWYLIRMIDDATSRSQGSFVEGDTTRANMAVLWRYVEENGRMVDTYTDRAGLFVTPRRNGESEEDRRNSDQLTQLGRAMRELGIGWIPAYSPQAKGRVERGFETDQDRLVKGLRLAKVKTRKGANEFLDAEYWPEWNSRFARSLDEIPNLHRPLTPQLSLAASLSHVEQRVINQDFTISFGGRFYQIARADIKAGMRRQPIRVELRLDGELKARFRDQYVEITECGKRPAPPPKASPAHVRKDHNAGGKSQWMQGFFERPAPELWKLVRDSSK